MDLASKVQLTELVLEHVYRGVFRDFLLDDLSQLLQTDLEVTRVETGEYVPAKCAVLFASIQD